MRYTLIAVIVVVVPLTASAQARDIGVTFVPALLQYLDVPPVCCPASVWITLGSGQRFRLQVDYLQSSRLSEGYGGYPHDDLVDGRTASTRRDSITQETLRDINVLAAWRAVVRDDAEVRVLFGAGARHTRRTDCTAFAGPSVQIPTPVEYGSDHILFHAKLTDQDHRRCDAQRYSLGGIYPQVGAAMDWPIGDRFFIRVDARLSILRLGIGGGVRF